MTSAGEPFLCYQCTEAAEDTAKYIERLGDAPNALLAFAARYGGHFVGHSCDPDSDRDDRDEEEEEVACCCACENVTDDVGAIEAVEAILNAAVCDECYEYIMEYMDTIGMTSEANSQLVVKVMAQRHGGNIEEHSCEAEDDDDVICHCGCLR